MRDKKVPLRLSTELSRARAYEDASDRAHTLLLELWATDTLLRLSQIAWSPTLKAHAAGLAERKQKLASSLTAMRTEPTFSSARP